MGWQHLSETTPKAAKDYRCYLCGLPITKGTKHVYRVGSDCGEIISTRMHIECESLTKNWKVEDWETHDEWEFRQEKEKGGAE